MTVTVFGSVNLDLTVYVDALPRPGETIHARRQISGLGGKGANQAVAARKLSAGSVTLLAATGGDAFGQTLREALAGHGLPLDQVVVFKDQPSGSALIHVDSNSQNTITVVGGANMAWPEEGPDPSAFEGVGVALFQLETPVGATTSAMRSAREAGATVILDPAPIRADGIGLLLNAADIVTPNETEAAALVGKAIDTNETALKAAHTLCGMGPGAAVVKMGGKGLVFATGEGIAGVIPAFAVTPVDTVAAGDCFNGALAVALDEGRPLPDALRFAAAAGALATTRYGASEAAPGRFEVDSLFQPSS
mgnify:CR=1 FL=1